jgi:alkylation response protein AidB-like acyl-CoA dehydrogenase
MRFALTDDQLAFRDAVRDLLVKECPSEVVRAVWPLLPDAERRPGQGAGVGARTSADRVDALWHALAEMGLLGLLVAERGGGLGLDDVTAAAVLEETGYAAVPLPIVETVCVAAPLLDTADRRDDLNAVITGDAIATAAHATGLVPFATTARWAVIAEVHSPKLVSLDATSVDAVESVDGSRHLGRVDAGSSEPLDVDEATVALACERAALGTAAQLIGLSRRMLHITVAYVGERRQFGAPVGSFQAVKHQLANARLKLEFAAPAVRAAAWSLATAQPSAARDVSIAKALASDGARVVGRAALQCHGAIGYTVEYDLHLYLKRAYALAAAWGDAAWHRNRVASAIGV